MDVFNDDELNYWCNEAKTLGRDGDNIYKYNDIILDIGKLIMKRYYDKLHIINVKEKEYENKEDDDKKYD